MSRAIEIIDTSGFYWSVSIDGNVIHLGKRLCRVDFGNADNLNSVLKDIEDVFIWRHMFSDVQSRTNTFNLLILLNSIYYESTLELFQYHCAEIMKQCDTPFAETFTKVFGSCPEKKYRRLSIVSEISKIYKDIHFQFYGPLKLKRSKYASNNRFCVKYTASIGNVISYTLNDEPLDICLSGKTHLAEATNVLSVIENLQDALAAEDKTNIISIFKEVGYLNALDIIRICYPELAVCFFTKIAERMIRTRQRVYPLLLLKSYIKTVPYQGKARQFFYALLEQLEDRVPYYEEQLIAGNGQELLSDKDTYTLYFRNANTLYCAELNFIGGFQLRKECKDFCLSYAKFGNTNLNVEKASLVSRILRKLFLIMFNELDIYIESIAFLTSADPSKKDEAKHLAKITKQIPLFGKQKEVQCLQVPSFKYDRLLDEPTTRMIPGYGICCNQTCKPQFEKCLACESFLPDPAYRDYFSAAIDFLLKRNQRIIQKHGDNTIVRHNEDLIHLYQACIKAIDNESIHRS